MVSGKSRVPEPPARMMPLRGVMRDAGRLAGAPEPLAGIALGGNLRAPSPVGQVPVDRFGEARLKRLERLPTELALNLRAVDGVAPVMARPVRHELDEGFMRAGGPRSLRIEEGADHLDDPQVGHLVDSTDVVGFARATPPEDEGDGPAVVLDVEP